MAICEICKQEEENVPNRIFLLKEFGREIHFKGMCESCRDQFQKNVENPVELSCTPPGKDGAQTGSGEEL